MKLDRSFGILLHPTSFPGIFGIGTLGNNAQKFINWLQAAGGGYWQVLPLGPTGYGDSPYSAICSFAGNPYLIDPKKLISSKWLDGLEPADFPDDRVDYEGQKDWKWHMLLLAFSGFMRKDNRRERAEFTRWRKKEAYWIEDYALYQELKKAHDQSPWTSWPDEIKHRQPEVLEQVRARFAEGIEFHCWTQWVFDKQWQSLRNYSKKRGISIIGDIPIFVGHDSPEVWAHADLFHLDPEGNPLLVAGVPPDYFSETGQLWGNPLYRWQDKKNELLIWWVERFKTVLRTCDLIRIDHFRGFEAYWEIEATAKTAVEGRWVKGPGEYFFRVLEQQLGQIPVIAEDLGVITPEVEKLRDNLGLPGMKVLQFAFDGNPENDFLPHRYPEHGNCIVYTGTHDNETSLGWYHNLTADQKQDVNEYLKYRGIPTERSDRIGWSLIQLAFSSSAKLAMIPLQDILSLDNKARMNTPSVAKGNWSWRYRQKELSRKLAQELRVIARDAKRDQ